MLVCPFLQGTAGHECLPYMLRTIAIIFGIVIAAVGGVIAYRSYFLEPSAAVLITNTDVRELPDTFRVVSGLVLLIVGAGIAYTAALRKN